MKKAKLNTVVSVSEIVSSFAIVISLFYALYEYQHSNTLSNKDAENIIYDRILEMDRLVIENEGLSKLIIKASDDSGHLTSDEKLRYLALEHIFFDSWESAFNYYHEGIFEQKTWDGWNNWFVAEIKDKPVLSWEGNRKNFNGEFLVFVDNIYKSID